MRYLKSWELNELTLTAESEKSENIQTVESTLKRSIGNVLPTSSGGQNISLISGNPFSYSQLGSLSTRLINEALSKSRINLNQVPLSELFKSGIELQQRKLIEQATQSLTEQILKAGQLIQRARDESLKKI